MNFRIGDIVEVLDNHNLKEFFPKKCIIDDKLPIFTKARYHIKTLDGKEHMTWVWGEEIDKRSIVRHDKLKKLGIK